MSTHVLTVPRAVSDDERVAMGIRFMSEKQAFSMTRKTAPHKGLGKAGVRPIITLTRTNEVEISLPDYLAPGVKAQITACARNEMKHSAARRRLTQKFEQKQAAKAV